MPKFLIRFHGRTRGAIGINYDIEDIVSCPDRDKVVNKLYEKYEGCYNATIKEASSEDIVNVTKQALKDNPTYPNCNYIIPFCLFDRDTVIMKRGNSGIESVIRQGKSIHFGRTPKEIIAEAGEGYEHVTWETAMEWLDEDANNMCRGEWKEITEEKYWEMLEVLPPEKWETVAGVNIFRMMEYWTADVTAHYAKYQGKYFAARRRASQKYEDFAKEIKEVYKRCLDSKEEGVE